MRTCRTLASGEIAAGSATTAAKPITQEQVHAMIAKIADAHDKEYDWKVSIVDLMKLLDPTPRGNLIWASLCCGA